LAPGSSSAWRIFLRFPFSVFRFLVFGFLFLFLVLQKPETETVTENGKRKTALNQTLA
jgi:hypothetical protein